MPAIQIFLSTVTAEFRSYRDALRHDLTRHNVVVQVQEDFIGTGTETLDKLDDYIRQCDAIIHLAGDMTGALAQPPSVAVIRGRYPDFDDRLPGLGAFLKPDACPLPYTQWEAWLALYHKRVLLIAVPEDGALRNLSYQPDEAQRDAQQEHLARLARLERYPEIRFANADRLAVEALRSKILDLLAKAGVAIRPVNLPYGSIRETFKGRADSLEVLAKQLDRVGQVRTSPAVALVLHGAGGIGKTRLVLEYAWRHADEYSALLFVGASDGAALMHNIAALSKLLELPEQQETDERKQFEAVIAWLRAFPGWLLILDNIDSESAASAVEGLLPRLFGGHVVLTSRLSNWSAGIRTELVTELSPEAAVQLLLARTEERRQHQRDDADAAETIARELGYLALALEQVSAYVARNRISLACYLSDWSARRDKVLAWFDKRLMQYHSSVAVTWRTSFDQLSPAASRMLQRIAWLAPEPIPESLLEVPTPGQDEQPGDAFDALVELESYSLVSRSTSSFSIHRLMQEVTRRKQLDALATEYLTQAFQWIDAAFAGDPTDVRSWLKLEPLVPHARAIIERASTAQLPSLTARLPNQLSLLLYTKANYAEAEPLMRRALDIDELSFGPDHPNVAIRLNNLAQLLQATNRLAQAEPLMRRAFDIDELSFGPDHPKVAIHLNNLAQLLQATNRLAEAEPLMRRALAILANSLGSEHPNTTTVQRNYTFMLEAIAQTPDEIAAQLASPSGRPQSD